MKTLYKLWVIVILCLLSNATHAQIYQYTPDGAEAFIDAEAKNAETERSCFCTARIGLILFDQYIPTGGPREEWLRGQEELLKNAMDGNINQNFSEVQRDYFRNTLIDNTEAFYDQVYDHMANLYNYNEQTLEISTLNHATLNVRNNLGTLDPLASRYGDLKYGDQFLRDMSDSQVQQLMQIQKEIRDNQRDAYQRYHIKKQLVDYAIANDQFVGYLANEYIKHYNSLSFEDSVRFMTAYILSVNLNDDSILDSSFGNNSNIFEVANRNHTLGFVGVTAFNPYDDTPIVFNELSEDEALFNYALQNHIKVEEAWFNRGRHRVKDELKKHLEITRYHRGALSLSEKIFWYYKRGYSFPSTEINFAADNNTIVYQFENRKDLAMNVAFPQFTWTGIGLREYNNVLYSLFNTNSANTKFEGQAITDIFNDNNISIPLLTPQEIAAVFEIDKFDHPIVGPPQMPIIFEGNLGEQLWNSGLRFPNMLQKPFVIEGLQAYANGEPFDFEFRSMVYELSQRLQLNQTQKDWLIANKPQAQALNNHYTTTNDAGFTTEALEAFRNGGEVDFFDEIILDSSFVHSRGKCVFDYIKQTNGSLFRNTIRNFIDNDEYDLKMVVESFPAEDNAIARTSDKDIDKGIITIRFNSNRINTVNPIEWASTILHEGVHAEIFRFVYKNDPTVKPEERARVIQLFLHYKDSQWEQEIQHIYMTEKYVIPIAKALRELDRNQFSLSHYMHFAWTGLTKHAPEYIKPSDDQLAEWALLGNEVLSNNNIPCQ